VTQVQQTTAAVVIAGCWGVLALVWAIGALYNGFKGPRRRRRASRRSSVWLAILIVVIVAAIARLVPTRDWSLLQVDSRWITVVGTSVLVASTALALWARLALGTMWSAGPTVKTGHKLRTDGPYAITRHPIYTGIHGMLLGTLLVTGGGLSLLVLPVGVVLLEVKIHEEERLMCAEFPDEYPRYRRRVPQLVPGLGRLRRDRAGDA
jgi:protein-S-isoprenylcysteine O-methyltransferase Ste14